MKLCLLTTFAGIAIAVSPHLVPTQAKAAPAQSTAFEVTVEYDDLDLTSERGVALLAARIEARVNQRCATGGRDGASLRLERRCREAALASTEEQVLLAVAKANADGIRLAEAERDAASSAHTPGV